jgi:hypothetical protein
MDLEAFGSIGDFVGGIGVIVSLLYLAVQIRQNTKAVRSSSYHQAAEQTWNYCLVVAQDATLAELLAKRSSGQSLTPAETLRAGAADQALLFGFENMLRLKEQGLVDPDVWENLITNSLRALDSPPFRATLAERPGPLSRRLLAEIGSRSPGTGDA